MEILLAIISLIGAIAAGIFAAALKKYQKAHYELQVKSRKELDDVNQALNEKEQLIAQHQQQLHDFERQIQEFDMQKEQIYQEGFKAGEQQNIQPNAATEQDSEINNLETALQSNEDENSNLQMQITLLYNELDNSSKKIDQLSQDLINKEQELNKLKTEYASKGQEDSGQAAQIAELSAKLAEAQEAAQNIPAPIAPPAIDNSKMLEDIVEFQDEFFGIIEQPLDMSKIQYQEDGKPQTLITLQNIVNTVELAENKNFLIYFSDEAQQEVSYVIFFAANDRAFLIDGQFSEFLIKNQDLLANPSSELKFEIENLMRERIDFLTNNELKAQIITALEAIEEVPAVTEITPYFYVPSEQLLANLNDLTPEIFNYCTSKTSEILTPASLSNLVNWCKHKVFVEDQIIKLQILSEDVDDMLGEDNESETEATDDDIPTTTDTTEIDSESKFEADSEPDTETEEIHNDFAAGLDSFVTEEAPETNLNEPLAAETSTSSAIVDIETESASETAEPIATNSTTLDLPEDIAAQVSELDNNPLFKYDDENTQSSDKLNIGAFLSGDVTAQELAPNIPAETSQTSPTEAPFDPAIATPASPELDTNLVAAAQPTEEIPATPIEPAESFTEEIATISENPTEPQITSTEPASITENSNEREMPAATETEPVIAPDTPAEHNEPVDNVEDNTTQDTASDADDSVTADADADNDSDPATIAATEAVEDNNDTAEDKKNKDSSDNKLSSIDPDDFDLEDFIDS